MTESIRNAPAPVAARGPDAGMVEPSSSDSGSERTPGAMLRNDRAPVIRSKIQPPALRSSTLSRQRLLDKLTDATSSRLTLVTAEAGYGKTTLLADFSARASARCLWYRLDPTDADPITWTNYLIAAVREIDPGFGRATESLLAQIGPGGPPESAFAASLLGELPSLGEAPTILVLDDFQEVDASTEARDYVSRLLRDAPAWLRFVISSRRRPSLELARLAGRGEVAELTTDELRFAPAETRDLFRQGYGIELDPDVLETVGDKTKGWAASLQLFQGSVHGRPASAVRAFAMSLSGADSPMYDFLAQEVLNNVDGDLEEFLLRSSLLDRVTLSSASALFPDRRGLRPQTREVASWIAECDQRGLLTKLSASSDARQLHPLLRDFLLRVVSQRHSPETIRQIHVSLAQSFEATDPLAASRHYIDAGMESEAMACLERSTMLAMGSGRWGDASRLADRLSGVPAGPAVAAMKARRLIDEGDIAAAAALLDAVDISESNGEIRSTVRHARFALGWRTGDRDAMYKALRDIQSDAEAPTVMRDIASIFIDSSPYSSDRATLPALAHRLVGMSAAHATEGMHFFSAVGLHNATVAHLHGGDVRAAIRTGEEAVAKFENLSFTAAEKYSTHCLLATAHLELGNVALAEFHLEQSLESGEEFADVPAEAALDLLALGERKRALIALARTEALVRQGRTDTSAMLVAETAYASALLPHKPNQAIEILGGANQWSFVDFGQVLARQIVLATAYLLARNPVACLEIAEPCLKEARSRVARRADTRLQILVALAKEDTTALTNALSQSITAGQLAILELADVIADHLDLFTVVPEEIERSVAQWPGRWLSCLRRQLDKGDVPSARVAAGLLDRYGEFEDIGRLRAFAKTYRRRGRLSPLGIHLAHRVSPRLQIHDLGRVMLSLADRSFMLAGMRRKPASLLMYLITRPSFAANREQVFDELWPDNDPGSASNSLNQSLYFLRRELDPWYEDEVSVDYLAVQGDLVWLEPSLVKADSAAFLELSQLASRSEPPLADAVDRLLTYSGSFAPEFEYEEWAMGWRSRVHSTFLDLASRTIDRAVSTGDLTGARDIAAHVLDLEPDNFDFERRLVWLYWHLGARSAAAALHQHLLAGDTADGFERDSLEAIVSAPKPT